MANMRVPVYERQVEIPQGQSASGRVAQPVRQAYGEDVQQSIGNLGKAIENVGKEVVNIEKNKMLILESKLSNIASNDLNLMKASSSLEEYENIQKTSLDYLKQTAKQYLGKSYDAWDRAVGQSIYTQINMGYDLNKIPFIKEQQKTSFYDLTNEYASNWSSLSNEDKLRKVTSFETSVDSSNLDPLEKRKLKQNFEISCFENEIVNANPLNYNEISSAINSSDLDEDKKYILQRRLINQISMPQSKTDPEFIRNIEKRINNGDIEDNEIQSYYTKGDISRTERDSLLRQNNSLYNQSVKAGIAEIKASIVSNPFGSNFEKQSFIQYNAIETFKTLVEANRDDIRQGKTTPMAIAQKVISSINQDYVTDKQNNLPLPNIVQQSGLTRQDMIAYTSSDIKEMIRSLKLRENEMTTSEFNSDLATLTRWYDMAMLRESSNKNIQTKGEK